MIRMTVPTGTMIFQIIMIVLPSAIHLTPIRLTAVNTNISTTANMSPLGVSRDEEFRSPCIPFTFRYPSMASTSMGAMATACR
jgi:hypothetical protein